MICEWTLPKVNAVLLAAFFSLTNLASIVSIFISIPYISVYLSILIILIACVYNKRLYLSKKAFRVYIVLLFVLLISLFINGVSNVINYFLYYIVFATTALFMSSLNVKYESVLNLILYINFVYLGAFFLFLRYELLGSDNYGLIQMGLSYSIVPFVLICLVYIIENFKHWKKNKCSILLVALLLVTNLYIILVYTITRGAILTVIIGFFALLMYNFDKKYRHILIAFSCVSAIVLLYFFAPLMEAVLSVSPDSPIGALNKLIKFSESGNIANGRDDLYNNAIGIISDSYYIGEGVGYFEKNNDSMYVHQFFLQLLCEVGLLGTIMFLLPLFRYFKKIITMPPNVFSNIYIVFFCSVITMLMFSNVHWFVPNFWILYFFIWNSRITNNRIEENYRREQLGLNRNITETEYIKKKVYDTKRWAWNK